jgi:16S rRNA (cytosine1402-N4)-methyltransferase
MIWCTRANSCRSEHHDYNAFMTDQETLSDFHHTPVLLRSVQEVLSPETGEIVLDVTLGLGGHAAMFLEAVGEKGKLIGLDADEKNLEQARKNLSVNRENLELHHVNFRELPTLNLPLCDIVFADLGLSSPHIDDPARGFTFREDAPLDMRFDRSQGLTGAEVLDSSSEEEIADILYYFGEIRQSRKIARTLKENTIKTTWDLKEATEKALGWRAKSILPQVFQALRISVNGELDALKILLEEGMKLLKPGGRMGIISFHSLEDRMVKRSFRDRTTPPKDPITGADKKPTAWTLLTRRAVMPTDEEISENPRARSARFRAILLKPSTPS